MWTTHGFPRNMIYKMVAFPHVFFYGTLPSLGLQISPLAAPRCSGATGSAGAAGPGARPRCDSRHGAEDLVMLLVSVWKITEVYGNMGMGQNQ